VALLRPEAVDADGDGCSPHFKLLLISCFPLSLSLSAPSLSISLL